MRVVVYLRTSTFDQNPEHQRSSCLKFAESRGYVVDPERDVFCEHISAWRGKERPKYDEIKSLAHRGEIKAVVVWALDRWIRDRESLLEDVNYLSARGVKFHSVQEPYLEAINIEGPLGNTIRDFLYGLIGSLAQAESDRKSERVKAAYLNSKNRDKWGRPKAKFNSRRAEYLLFECGKSLRQVASEVGTSLATIQRFKKECGKNR